jgi:cysteine synthase
VTAILWVVSLAAHLGFDHLVGGHGTGGTCFGNATILLYLAVTFAVRRMVVIARSQRISIPGQNQVTGLT